MNQFDEVGYEESVSSKVELLNRQSRKPQARTIYLSRHSLSRKQRSKTHYNRQPSYNSISSVDSAEVLENDQYAIEPSKLEGILCHSFFNQSMINFNLQRQKIRCVSSIDHSEEQQPIKQTQHSQRSIKFFQSPVPSESRTKFKQRESFQVMQPNLTSNNGNNSRFSLFQQQQSLNNSQYTIDLPMNNDCISLNSNSRKLIHISDRDLLNQIIELLFSKNIQFLRQLLLQMQIEYRNDALNQLDHNGNTPLMLAVKLNYKSPSIEMVRSLLQYGSDPSIKDSNKWSPIEESVSQRDLVTTGLLFDYIVKKKQMDLQRERVAIDQELLLLDDFYIEMKWEFQSSIIPFLSKIAPHDVFRIYKRNTSLRLDTTFVGQSHYKAKRRDITVLYNPLIGQRQRKENSSQCKFVTVLNKSKGIYFYPMTEIDPDEKKLILLDLLNSDSIIGDMKVINCQLNKSKSIFGNYIQSQIGEWKCNKYDFKVKTEQCFNKKNHTPFLLNYQQYTLSIIEKKSSTRYNMESFTSRFLDTVSLQKQESSRSVDTKSKSSKNNCQLHITDQFPIKFGDLLPILKMLSKGNQFMQSMLKIIEDESVSQVIKQNGFPLKITVPVNFSVDAVVTFQAFKVLV